MSDALESDLRERLSALGAEIGRREASHRADLERARAVAERLHGAVVSAVEAFHASVESEGAPHLRLEVSAPELDQKHVRSVEFEVRRGRIVGIVTVKSRGDVTLVGPFRRGKNEGPCRSIAVEAEPELQSALTEFLSRVAEEAATP